ncbi:MAG: UDP-N-acetylglucosamine 2-epimerase, partial [Planctomycetota bacterium]
RICFATGTRAEFGLMRTTLQAIRDHADLQLQITATGMHLDPAAGRSVDAISGDGWTVDAEIPWNPAADATQLAVATGHATAGLAEAFDRLETDIVLVVGDRVEALAAATAGHLSGRIVAHVHGGDRATGQADDAMRHAITKLSHIHFPATPGSAERLLKLGEVPESIHMLGAPGIDGVVSAAAERQPDDPEPGTFALIVLHPTRDDVGAEFETADRMLTAVRSSDLKAEIVMPNNDLGREGIARRWNEARDDADVRVHDDLPRPRFLRLMADAAALVGNSSSGIIEAASFGTPVLDVGPRQTGRERSDNVLHCDESEIADRLPQLLSRARWTGTNVYGADGTGKRIADVLAGIDLSSIGAKLINY